MPYSVLLTSSNARDDLDAIKYEFEQLKECFDYPPIPEVVKVIINHTFTPATLFSEYMRHPDIRLFHYSGHAGDGKILDANRTLWEGDGMTAMIGGAQNLHLVFLNGCGTRELVDDFLNRGAKIVIATNGNVLDKLAAYFSVAFYQALCKEGKSIGESFEFARIALRKFIIDRHREKERDKERLDGIPVKPEEDLNAMIDAINDDPGYREMVKGLFSADASRRISSAENSNLNNNFAWGIYCKDNRAMHLTWKLIAPGDGNEVVLQHQRPFFHLLKTIGELAYNAKDALVSDDQRKNSFSAVIENLANARDWGQQATNNLMSAIEGIFMAPVRPSFHKLINKGSDLSRKMNKEPRELLQFQLDFYWAFMRTSTVIMLSDFIESAIHAYNSDDEVKSAFGQILGRHNVLGLLQGLLDGSKDMDDIEFCIQLSRQVFYLLKDSRARFPQKEEQWKFAQFVDEYNANTVGTPLMTTMLDLNHQILLFLTDECNSKRLDQCTYDHLRVYCDKAESALIELMKAYSFTLQYDIVTVGKVEANRQRDNQIKTFVHNVVTFNGTLEFDITDEFIENYSVVLRSYQKKRDEFHRKPQDKDYLSLSPLMFDAPPFFGIDKSNIFRFIRKKDGFLEYSCESLDGFDTIKLKITGNEKDGDFLNPGYIVKRMLDYRDDLIKDKALARFVRVRNQFNLLEEIIGGLVTA